VTLVGVWAIFTGVNEIRSPCVRPASRRSGLSSDKAAPGASGPPGASGRGSNQRVRNQRSSSEPSSGSRTDGYPAAPARQGAERCAEPGRVVGGPQPRSRGLCGGRRHDNAHVWTTSFAGSPGPPTTQGYGSPVPQSDRRRSTRPLRRNQRPGLPSRPPRRLSTCCSSRSAAGTGPTGPHTTCRSPAVAPRSRCRHRRVDRP
jgi:hypothetical protein